MLFEKMFYNVIFSKITTVPMPKDNRPYAHFPSVLGSPFRCPRLNPLLSTWLIAGQHRSGDMMIKK